MVPAQLTAAPSIEGELGELIAAWAERTPTAPALLDDASPPLTYRGLLELLRGVERRLREGGIAAGDRVAIVLPNGPEMAAAFLATAHCAAAAPLNPAYTRQEFEFYLRDLNARLLMVLEGESTPAVEAAAALGIPVTRLRPTGQAAGEFELSEFTVRPAAGERERGNPATALLLHTSGTTSRPKLVPLTRANLRHSAAGIAASLELTSADRCLNVMPLFHIHGLVGALLASLHAGGSVFCLRRNDPQRLVEQLAAHGATWYTAVPTLHQAVLAASPQGERPAPLRFIRSCSAPLPPAVMRQLEDRFQVPVVEAYGMTEASHQMTCNPLPPRRRKPGSVGVATGLEVAVMDAAGRLLPPETTGEVVIRGPGVTAGYEDNPEANGTAYTEGWFRTGDQGYLDREGYLFLTGRIKELINRGGEKIAPREIDDALLTHPAVAQAAAFSMPHPTLGEEVAAAVVLRPGSSAAEADLQQHVARRLASFKVPRRVVFVPELPKGPTGKPQRIGLAERLGVSAVAAPAPESMPAAAPGGEVELRMRELWTRILGHGRFGREQSFFECGGDSLTGSLLLSRISQEFGVELPVRTLFQAGTVAGLAEVVESRRFAGETAEPRYESLVPFQTEGARPPFFMVHGHSGRSLGLGFIAPYLEDDQPYYGFVARGMDGRRLPHADFPSMARDYIAEMRRVQPRGPYYLGGFCSGGFITYEMALQLRAAGEEIGLLALLDTVHPSVYRRPGRATWLFRAVKRQARRAAFATLLLARGRATIRLGERIVNETNRRRAMEYTAADYPETLTLIRSQVHHRTTADDLGWGGRISGRVEVHPIPGEHANILTPLAIEPAARAIQRCLNAAQQAGRGAGRASAAVLEAA